VEVRETRSGRGGKQASQNPKFWTPSSPSSADGGWHTEKGGDPLRRGKNNAEGYFLNNKWEVLGIWALGPSPYVGEFSARGNLQRKGRSIQEQNVAQNTWYTNGVSKV